MSWKLRELIVLRLAIPTLVLAGLLTNAGELRSQAQLAPAPAPKAEKEKTYKESPFFESHRKIWVSDGAPDDYPWRVRIKKEKVVAPETGVPAASLVPQLRFVRKWPKASWRLAFQGNVHELPAADFALIARAVAERARSRAA